MASSDPARVPQVRLNNGVVMPQLGLGTAGLTGDAAREVTERALATGYRFVDTAASYDNEAEVGQALARSGVPRDEVFVSTKLRGSEQGYESARRALASSLDRLGLDHVDLYLIHWPLPRVDRYVESWRSMTELLSEGQTRAIGVSNFLPEHLDRLAEASPVVPAVNQIELHPREPQTAQRADDDRRGIITQSWSPLARGELLDEPTLRRIAESHEKSPGQVVLRWHVQQGLVTFPKSSHGQRLRENLAVFDFELSPDDMTAIAGLENGKRVNDQDPRTYEEF